MTSELQTIRVLEFNGEISNREGLYERLSLSRRMELKKLNQGKENFRLNQEEELEIERTSNRDGKFKQQDCCDRNIVERLICNAIIVIRCNIKKSIARKYLRIQKRILHKTWAVMRRVLQNWDYWYCEKAYR